MVSPPNFRIKSLKQFEDMVKTKELSVAPHVLVVDRINVQDAG